MDKYTIHNTAYIVELLPQSFCVHSIFNEKTQCYSCRYHHHHHHHHYHNCLHYRHRYRHRSHHHHHHHHHHHSSSSTAAAASAALLWSGPHSTNGFSIAIQIRCQVRFTLSPILIQWSLQNFVHVLSWHVQKFVAIWFPAAELQQGTVSMEFELRAKQNVTETASSITTITIMMVKFTNAYSIRGYSVDVHMCWARAYIIRCGRSVWSIYLPW